MVTRLRNKILTEDNLKDLRRTGWATTDYDGEDGSLLRIASALGTAVPPKRNAQIIQTMTPHDGASDPGTSFSKVFGVGTFPLHTDTAHWSSPARFVILADAGSRHDRPTLVLAKRKFLAHFDEVDVSHSVWRSRGLQGGFLCSLSFQTDAGTGIRFDPLCMRPFNGAARSLAAAIAKTHFRAVPIEWRPKLVLIIDNWQVLHGRGVCSATDTGERILKRVIVVNDETN